MPPNVGSSAATVSMNSFVSLRRSPDRRRRCRELLEQARLAFHHRLARQRADVAQAQHSRAVGDDRDQVAARRVIPGQLGRRGDLQARLCHTRRIRQRQVALRDERLGRDDLDLSGPTVAVVVERVVLPDHLA
jgi:hypothetical protein